MKKTLFICLTLTMIFSFTSCDESKKGAENEETTEDMNTEMDISLAQWSLHQSFFGDRPDWATFGRLLQENPDSLYQGELHPDDFPSIAKGMGFDIIELVNTFYYSKPKNMDYWKSFKEKCDKEGVQVGLIMCDALGDLGNADEAERMKAVENHYPWVDVADYLGAHTIRVNAAGAGTAEEVAANAVNGLKKLGEYGASKGINIVVENHGSYSSNGAWLAGVMEKVGMDNVGTLPDFGNFCIERGPNNTCVNEYDKYKGIAELMPYAKGVSAKTNNFDDDGNEKDIDYVRVMKIVKDSGFTGTIGIEYEGDDLSEKEGIMETKELLVKVLAEI